VAFAGIFLNPNPRNRNPRSGNNGIKAIRRDGTVNYDLRIIDIKNAQTI
jgi:hypothetical protein